MKPPNNRFQPMSLPRLKLDWLALLLVYQSSVAAGSCGEPLFMIVHSALRWRVE